MFSLKNVRFALIILKTNIFFIPTSSKIHSSFFIILALFTSTRFECQYFGSIIHFADWVLEFELPCTNHDFKLKS